MLATSPVATPEQSATGTNQAAKATGTFPTGDAPRFNIDRLGEIRSRIHDRGSNEIAMKTTAAIAVFAILLVGCTSLQPVDMPPEALREQVRASQIARPGERVSVTTEDGVTHEFKIVEVTDRAIRGDAVDVPINAIVSVRTRKTNPAKTALAVAGAVGIVYVVAALDAVDDVIDDLFAD